MKFFPLTILFFPGYSRRFAFGKMFPANMFSYKGMIIEHTKYRTMILFHSFMIKCRPLGGKKGGRHESEIRAKEWLTPFFYE